MAVTVFSKKTALDSKGQCVLMFTVYMDYSFRPPKLIDFTVLLLFSHEGQTVPVIRFDCSHGFLNVHQFYRSQNDRTDFPNQKSSAALLEECRREVVEKWAQYRDWFIQKWFLN